MFRLSGLVLVLAAGLVAASVVHAQVNNVFNMPNGEASVQFVPVGDPGNAADPATGSLYGSVGYAFNMGKYDVTVGQYCQFLNAVAATDTYGLYNPDMASINYYYPTVGIVQSGSPGSYTYSVSYTASAWNPYVAYNSSLYPSALAAANDAPVFEVTWGDAARFANWLQNGQPTNLGEAAGSTETGAYTLNGDTTNLTTETRNAGATYFIPSENEWYKAAYFNPSNSTYWTYPTQSNSTPSNVLSSTGTNNANFDTSNYTDPTNYLTPVGAFAGSPGPFGTYDMGGDLWQWNEANISNGYSNDYRGMRGGWWDDDSGGLRSAGRGSGLPTGGGYYITGFRVASVPEPSTITLLLASAACLLGYAWRRRSSRKIVACLAVLSLAWSAGLAHADVFNMGGTRNPTTGVWTGEASLQFVTVGDPGNATDSTGFGAVGYVYQMGKYDVTVGQYVQFLNAVAAADTYGLYNGGMATGVNCPTIGITQSGAPGSYTYSVSGSYSKGVNCPIFGVSWGDAARFCNWLQNDQPTGAEGPRTTETGAYNLNGATSQSALMAVARNPGATYFIPSEDEWYKAAYYKGGSQNAGYWTYETQSNSAPSNVLSATGTNNANCAICTGGTYPGYTYSMTDQTNFFTPVGAFAASPGPYGTFDQGGDVWQWSDTVVSNMYGTWRGMRGGAFDPASAPFPSSSMRGFSNPTFEPYSVGFRVASIPEPSAITILLASAACLFGYGWRRRKRNS